VCMRLLEKEPEARYADAKALAAALSEEWAQADRSWRAPLFPGSSRDQSPSPAPARPEGQALSRGFSLGLLVGLVLVAVLGGFALLAQRSESQPPQPPQQASPRQEMAPVQVTGDVGLVAGPPKSTAPAPVASATHSEDPPMKKPKTPDSTPKRQPQPTGRLPSLKKAAATGAACALLESGCTGSTAQVRPEPAPMECPAGSRDTHARFRVYRNGSVVLQGHKGYAGDDLATVKEGPVTVVFDLGWKEFPPGTLLTGTLTVGEKRFFGRFTQAQTPDRQTYPVCIQIYTPGESVMRGGQICTDGVGFCLQPGSKPSAFQVFPRFDVEVTDRFE
jgi:hypothetical protein